MSGDGGIGLSAAGEARRAEILRAAHGALRGRRRRRAAARAVAVAAPVVAVVAAAAWLSLGRAGGGGGTAAPEVAGGAAVETPVNTAGAGTVPEVPATFIVRVPTARPARIVEVPTITGLADRLGDAGSARAPIDYLTDDELLEALRAMGRPTGLIRTQGRVVLTARVTGDEEDPAAEWGHGSG